jgi:hypothetical protein
MTPRFGPILSNRDVLFGATTPRELLDISQMAEQFGLNLTTIRRFMEAAGRAPDRFPTALYALLRAAADFPSSRLDYLSLAVRDS